jgi:hypothetical protein
MVEICTRIMNTMPPGDSVKKTEFTTGGLPLILARIFDLPNMVVV